MIDNTSFLTANENMAYDADLFARTEEHGNRFIRVYHWQQPGLTQSEKRDIPEDLLGYDYSYRLTGGGVVFHSPADIVFSIALSSLNKFL